MGYGSNLGAKNGPSSSVWIFNRNSRRFSQSSWSLADRITPRKKSYRTKWWENYITTNANNMFLKKNRIKILFKELFLRVSWVKMGLLSLLMYITTCERSISMLIPPLPSTLQLLFRSAGTDEDGIWQMPKWTGLKSSKIRIDQSYVQTVKVSKVSIFNNSNCLFQPIRGSVGALTFCRLLALVEPANSWNR